MHGVGAVARQVWVGVVALGLLAGSVACSGDGDPERSDASVEDTAPAPTAEAEDAAGSDDASLGGPFGPGPGSAEPHASYLAASEMDLPDACPAGAEVHDGAWTGAVESAVGVDDPEVEGVGDAGFEDLGDPGTDVTHYHLRLEIDPDEAAITSGVANIVVTAEDDLEELAFDLAGMDVAAVAVDGEAVAARREGARLVVPAALAEGHEAVVTVCYAGTPEAVPSEAIFGAKVGWGRASDGVFVLSEPEGARTWFPVDDHPSDKATYDFELVVPDGWVAIANGVGGEVAGSEGEFAWAMRQPMAPYLATVVVTTMEHRSFGEVGGIPVGGWGRPEELDGPMASHAEALELLAEIFGPYPFERLDGAMLPGYAIDNEIVDRVALETQGLPIYGAEALHTGTVVHEVAHQWFGNSVSLTSWTRDLWWVEGMATFSEWLWMEHDDPNAYVGMRDRAMGEVARTPGEIGDLDPEDLFGRLTYQGGAVVFAALREEVGDEVLLEALRTFLDRHRWGNATTDDLVDVVSEVHGEDLGPFFARWLGPAEDRPTTIG